MESYLMMPSLAPIHTDSLGFFLAGKNEMEKG